MKKTTIAMILLLAFCTTCIVGTAMWGSKEWWFEWMKEENIVRAGPQAGWTLLALAAILRLGAGELKGKTNRWVAHNRAFLVNRNDGVYDAGQYWARRFGGINVPGLGVTIPGNDGTLIVPKVAVVEYGPNAIVQAVAKKVPFDHLPPEVKDIIIAEDLPAPFFFAQVARFVETRGKDWTQEDRQYRIANSGQHHELVSLRSALDTAQATIRAQARYIKRLESPGVRRFARWVQTAENERQPPAAEPEREYR